MIIHFTTTLTHTLVVLDVYIYIYIYIYICYMPVRYTIITTHHIMYSNLTLWLCQQFSLEHSPYKELSYRN